MADGSRNSFSDPLNFLKKNHSPVPSEEKLLVPIALGERFGLVTPEKGVLHSLTKYLANA